MTESGFGVIVILSFATDPHVPMVTNHLDRWSVPWALMPVDRAGDGVDTTICVGPTRSGSRFRCADITFEAEEVKSVWNRRWMRPRAADFHPEDAVQQYVAEQWWHTIDGALRTTSARWVNPAVALELARSKPRQLLDAAAQGLTIPPTLVTADLDELRAFADDLNLEQLITKVVSPGTPIVADGVPQYMIFTQLITVADLERDSVRAAPAIYQPLLAKEYEVRATVVADDVLACRIDSMASPQTALDWRRYDFERVEHRPINAPDEIKEHLLALCRRYGLVFAAADFVVTADGEWVFLELNPNGQWGWIEELTGLPIGERIARQLVQGS